MSADTPVQFNEDKPSKFRAWITEMRLAFLTGTIMPIFVGTAVAFFISGIFLFDFFLLTLIAGACLHLGANVSNDYFDHKSGTDDINVDYVRPFSGGARMIQLGYLSPREVLFGSFVFFGIAGGIGLYLAYTRGFLLIILGIIGAGSGFFYTAPPFRFVSRGYGEVFIGLNFGVLMTFGAYYVQAQDIILEPFAASIPIAILITTILYINEFPDFKADKAVMKYTVVVRLGLERASKGYVVLMSSVYASVLLMILFSILHWYMLVVLATIPLAVVGMRTARSHYDHSLRLIPAYAATIQTHLFTGLFMTGAYVIAGFQLDVSIFLVYLVVCFMLGFVLYRKLAGIKIP